MRAKNALKTVFSVGFCLAALTGCDWVKDWPPGGKAAVRQPQPQVKLMQTADSTWIAPEPTAPPQEHLVPADPEAQNGLKRLEKLEGQIETLRNDMGALVPAMTKLTQMQAALQQEVVAQRQEAAPVSSQPVQVAPAVIQPEAGNEKDAAKPALPQALVPSAATATPVGPVSLQAPSAVVRQVRVGEHPDKTRIVLDASDNVAFSYDLDNDSHSLIIKMPAAGWTAPVQAGVANSPLIQSWKAVPDGKGGAIMTISLRRAVKVLSAETLSAAENDNQPRIVVDLASL